MRAALTAALVIFVVSSCGTQAGTARQPRRPSAALVTTQVPGYGVLDGVSCLSATDCMAVGWSSAGRHDLALAAHWDGQRWRRLAIGDGSGSTELKRVSCWSADGCLAVGTSGPQKSPAAVAEAWDGSTWRLAEPALPAGTTSGQLSGVSCPHPARCMVVGGYTSRRGRKFPLAESWDGHNWRVLRPPSPTRVQGAWFNGITCGGPAACMAIGFYNPGRGTCLCRVLAEAWAGQRWRLLAPITPAGKMRESSLHAIACPRAGTCIAVGATGSIGGFTGPLSESWQSGAWRLIHFPGSYVLGNLTSLSCPAAAHCVAVGSNAMQSRLAAIWNGTGWHPLHLPATRLSAETFSDVSCATTRICMAVGYIVGASAGGMLPLAQEMSVNG